MSKIQITLIVLVSLALGAFGAGLVKDRVKRSALVDACIESGAPDVCYLLGQQAYHEGKLDSARVFLSGACSGNLVQACTDLSVVYFLKKDYESALKFANLACEQNDSDACYNVACAWCLKDRPEEAARVLKTLAEKGYFWTAEHREHSLKDPDLECLKKTGELERIVTR